MKFNYRLSRICGNVFENGNLCFTPDGNSIVSPVGNRVNVFDLVKHTSVAFPFENKKNIRLVVMSNNGRFLVTIDVEGHALFINFERKVILQRFHFKRKVYDMKFSPNDQYFAVTFGNGCQIWKTPGIEREFCPLTFCRTIGGHSDDVTCLDWSVDSENIVMGSKDLHARVYYRVNTKRMSKSVLSGHRDRLMGVYYSNDPDTIYTIAKDGAVFTWKFEYGDRIAITNGELDEEEEGSEAESEEEQSNKKIKLENKPQTKRTGKWKLAERTFLWESQTKISAVDFNKETNLLVIGFDNGVYGLYEMPTCTNIHKLSVSNQSINTVAINKTGEWLALGSAKLGQLLVWEWKSESYVIKQQGHVYGLNALDYSHDGMYIATGGEDCKVKLWSTSTGFCFITFTEHIAPVTGVKFVGVGNGKAILSSSLDGTIRAHDLLRYKNFRTLTTPNAVQFTCLAVDSSGEMVCAGSLDPFNIYVWALQTGQLLEVLAGHEAPIACLDFVKSGGSTLASGSWDGTLKLWNIYNNECTETMEHGCDVLAVAYRPDGQEVCTATTNGLISIWDTENGTLKGTIEGRRDIAGGRRALDAISSETSSKSKYFNALAYTADGTCILAAGKSKFVCLYSIASKTLIKKFQLSHNRSIDGVIDELRSDRFVDGVSLDNLSNVLGGDGFDSEDEQNGKAVDDISNLPGAGKGSAKDGASRSTLPEILTSALGFSSTGREWAVATTQGLQIFSLDNAILFAPTDLDIAITPQTVLTTISKEEFGLAINMALHLSEKDIIKAAVDAVPLNSIDLVCKSIDARMIKEFMTFIAEQIAASRHIEFYLRWCASLINSYGDTIMQSGDIMSYGESVRSLIRAISIHEKEILRMNDSNYFNLEFLEHQHQGGNSVVKGESLLEKGDDMDVVIDDNEDEVKNEKQKLHSDEENRVRNDSIEQLESDGDDNVMTTTSKKTSKKKLVKKQENIGNKLENKEKIDSTKLSDGKKRKKV